MEELGVALPPDYATAAARLRESAAKPNIASMTRAGPSVPAPHRCEIVLSHSLLGLRPAVLQWAADLRAMGHVVHAPDLYDGEVFDTMTRAAEWLQPIGFDGVLARAAAAVSTLPREVVYAGFSNGGACAELLAETRKGARGAILMGAPLPIRAIRRAMWPAGVAVHVHFSQRDPLRSQAVIDTLGAHVRAAPAEFQDFTYSGGGHLFSDPGQRGYDAAASMLMWTRVTDFLERVARPPTEPRL